MSPLRGSTGGHGGAHCAGLLRLGGATPCPRSGDRRRRPLASGPGSIHGPERDGMGRRHLLLRSSHASEGGGGT